MDESRFHRLKYYTLDANLLIQKLQAVVDTENAKDSITKVSLPPELQRIIFQYVFTTEKIYDHQELNALVSMLITLGPDLHDQAKIVFQELHPQSKTYTLSSQSSLERWSPQHLRDVKFLKLQLRNNSSRQASIIFPRPNSLEILSNSQL